MKQVVQLFEILGNKKVMGILHFFISNPTLEISQVGIIKKKSISKATAVKWLAYLVEKDFLFCKKIAVTNLYRLNNDNLLIKQLKIINTINQIFWLKKLSDKNIEIYLYGSTSRGEDTENSDIDLLILGNIQREDLVNIIDTLSKNIKRRIAFNIFTEIEWSMMEKKDKPYYERVEKDKLRIV